MSDLEVLFLVVACLYGWECACWLRRGSVGFITWLGRRWRPVHPGALVGNQHGSFILAPPLPPLGRVLTGNQFPLSLSADGVLAFVSFSVNPGSRPQQTGRFFRFDEIRAVEVKGRKLLLNGEVFLKAASPGFANHLATCMRQLMKTPESQRAPAIEKIFREAFDSKVIEKRWNDFKTQTSTARWLANTLFVYVFILIPAAIWRLGLKASWLPLLIGLLFLTTSIAVFFHRAHKALYPDAEDERFTHFLTILLAPVTSIRAADILSRPLLETFHPLAIARILCSPEQFHEFAGRILRDIHFPAAPVCPSNQSAAVSTERDSRALLQKTVEEFLQENKTNPADLLRPPQPLDETCRAYCPRCLSQFTTSEGSCADCGGLQLLAFEKNQKVIANEVK